MTLATYNDLVSAIQAWLHRDDLAGQVPDFLTLAEIRLSREIRIPDMHTEAQITVPDTGEAALPPDLVELIRVRDAEGDYLDRVPLPDLEIESQLRPTDTLYAVRGRTLIIRPKPDSGGTVDVTVEYYQAPARLSSSNQTNLWTQLAPDALLYGALLEASAFLYDDPRVPLWQERFDRTVAAIQSVGENPVNSPQFGLRYAPAHGGV